MKSKIKFNLFFVSPLLSLPMITTGTTLFGQYLGKKNTIRINLTNPVIFGGQSIILGYERTIGKRQSFSVDIGKMGMPFFGPNANSDSVKVEKNSGDKGFHISGDYRFYLAKENKFEAPRGVYIGPYYAYNHFKRANTWSLNTVDFKGSVTSNIGLDVHAVGFELGYQFVLWKWFAIDMVLAGPGVGFYKVKAGIDANLSEGDQALLFERLNNYLGDKIPGYNLVIKEGNFNTTGTEKTTALGYRYG